MHRTNKLKIETICLIRCGQVQQYDGGIVRQYHFVEEYRELENDDGCHDVAEYL